MSDKRTAALLMAAVVSSLISIFLTNILFAAAFLSWIVDCRRSKRLILAPLPLRFAFLAYASGIVVSMLFSFDTVESLINLKKLLLFSSVFLLAAYLNRARVLTTLRWITATLALSAALGAVQYFWLMDVDPLHRIVGLMSHWMTFSGQLMLGVVALASFLLLGRGHEFGRGGRAWGTAALLLALVALVLTWTRSAWLGAIVGLVPVTALFGLRPRKPEKTSRIRIGGLRWTVLMLAAIGLMTFFLPQHYHQRLRAAFDLSDYTTRIRLELLATGANMIAAHPWTGVGPRMVPHRYQDYTFGPENFPPEAYIHLHNNFVQVAAESGLPTFAFWLTMWILQAFYLVRLCLAAGEDRFLFATAVAGLVALTAFLTAGMMEYNFGDSEVLILLLFFVAAPYVIDQDQRSPAESGHPRNAGNPV